MTEEYSELTIWTENDDTPMITGAYHICHGEPEYQTKGPHLAELSHMNDGVTRAILLPVNVIKAPAIDLDWEDELELGHAIWSKSRNTWKRRNPERLSPLWNDTEIDKRIDTARIPGGRAAEKATTQPSSSATVPQGSILLQPSIPQVQFATRTGTPTGPLSPHRMNPYAFPTAQSRSKTTPIRTLPVGNPTTFVQSQMTNPAPTTATVSTSGHSSLKANKPIEYNGRRDKYEEFINSVKVYLFVHKGAFPDNGTKIAWFLGFLREGEAAQWGNEFLKRNPDLDLWQNKDWKEFLKEFEDRFYRSGTTEQKAFNRLKDLKQGGKNTQAHITLFRTLIYEAGIEGDSDISLVQRFLMTLRPGLMSEIIRHGGFPKKLQEAIDTAIECSNQYELMQQMLGKKPLGNQNWTQRKENKDPNAMDTSPDYVNRLSESEQKCCRDAGLCFTCKEKEHRANDPKFHPKTERNTEKPSSSPNWREKKSFTANKMKTHIQAMTTEEREKLKEEGFSDKEQ